MPTCYCPEELGGSTYFEPASPELPDWMPTRDHFPILKQDGGHLTVDNVRLAHRLCNRIDYTKTMGYPKRDLERVRLAREAAVRLKRRVEGSLEPH
jgi:hypothetical protein